MIVIVEKKYDRKKINQLIEKFKPVKSFDAKKFAGTINWEEEPLKYQKRIRNEWD
jgi:hypothetical protein